MAAADQKKRGQRTKEKVWRRLAKTPKTADRIAFLLGISPGLARRYLKKLLSEGKAVAVPQAKGLKWMATPHRCVVNRAPTMRQAARAKAAAEAQAALSGAPQ